MTRVPKAGHKSCTKATYVPGKANEPKEKLESTSSFEKIASKLPGKRQPFSSTVSSFFQEMLPPGSSIASIQPLKREPTLLDGLGNYESTNALSITKSNNQVMIDYHMFKVKTLHQPTNCDHCKKFIWGLRKQSAMCTSRNFDLLEFTRLNQLNIVFFSFKKK
jgi:hypothetical protein